MEPVDPNEPPNPLTLTYGRSAAGPTFSVSSFLAVGVVLGVVFFPLVFVVPRFERIFKDFGTEIPGLTKLVLAISRLCVDFWWICGVFLILLPTICGFIFGARRQEYAPATPPLARTTRRLSLITLVVVILGLYIAFLVLVLFLPMLNLIEAISGQGGK